MTTVAFDIGGWISRYPELTKNLAAALRRGGVKVVVLTDIFDEETAEALLERNGFTEYDELFCVRNWDQNRERCKAILCREKGVDLLIDDYAPYCNGEGFASLLVWPKEDHPYDAPGWKI